MTLTPREIEQFKSAGYLIFEGLIPSDRLARYVALFDELLEKANRSPVGTPHLSYEKDGNGEQTPGLLHKIQGVCDYDARVLELARDAAIVNRIESLVVGDVDCFGTKFFPKLPGRGTSTSWHQDNFYFGTDTDRIISCGIYLEPTDAANGCLRVVPGSHKDGAIREHKPIPTRHGSWTEVDESAAVDIVCPGGTAVFFSANLLHGAYDNRTADRTRYSTAWHYLPADLALKGFERAGDPDRHAITRRETAGVA